MWAPRAKQLCQPLTHTFHYGRLSCSPLGPQQAQYPLVARHFRLAGHRHADPLMKELGQVGQLHASLILISDACQAPLRRQPMSECHHPLPSKGALPVTEKIEPLSYAMRIADGSFAWYRTAAIRSRRLYRSAEISIIIVSALVPLSAAVLPGNTIIPATLGSAVVVIAGLRSVFHWHENYLRFSHAREAIEAERRRFRTGALPYNDDQTREAVLAEAITRIEQEEMGKWLKVAAQPAREPSK